MLTIGRVAARTNTTTDTLRFYERERLIVPTKAPNGYRQYGEDSVQRVQFIKHAQQCGFTLAEIRDLLDMRKRADACCNDMRTVAVEKKLQIEGKIRAFQAMSKSLSELIGTCTGDELPLDECPILEALDSAIEIGTVKNS